MTKLSRLEPKILAFATQGSRGNDETRLRQLLGRFCPRFLDFESNSPKAKLKTFFRLICEIRKERPDLVVMEGTGVFGGFALLISKLLFGSEYVVGSGDAVGPFFGTKMPIIKPFFDVYERSLYKHAAGFIGWTPYLVGRALTFGVPRAMSAPGWGLSELNEMQSKSERARVRSEIGISENTVVIGIVGSLAWNSRVGYCYGYELVRALQKSKRKDCAALVVGDGTGLCRLKALASSDLGKRIYLVGAVPREQVPSYLSAMDVASLPQSVDQVGSFRYTTKLSEFLDARLPVVTGQIPLSYDLDEGWLWRLAGGQPWSEIYSSSLAQWLDSITQMEIAEKRSRIELSMRVFDKEIQIERTTNFIGDLFLNQGSSGKANNGSRSYDLK